MSDPTNSKTPEQFAVHLRLRAEEALSASVHHASLSQQYLTLSQKFAALSEQAAGNPADILHSVYQLEREATTGAPSSPIGGRQVAWLRMPIQDDAISSSPEAISARVVEILTRERARGKDKVATKSLRDEIECDPKLMNAALLLLGDKVVADGRSLRLASDAGTRDGL